MDSLLLLKLIGVLLIFVTGSLFHFLYKYGGKRPWMAFLSPVNESLWEHLKIGFYPFLIFSFFQVIFVQDLASNFFSAEFVGVYVVLGFILITELIYPSILKKNVLIIDLLIFFLAILAGQLVSYFVFKNYPDFKVNDLLIGLTIVLNVIIFGLFSFKTPRLGIFKDSMDGKYGVKKGF